MFSAEEDYNIWPDTNIIARPVTIDPWTIADFKNLLLHTDIAASSLLRSVIEDKDFFFPPMYGNDDDAMLERK